MPTENFSMNTRMPKICYCGLGLLPVSFCVLSILAVITTYVLAVSNDHVYPFFPTISETGEQEPERNVFSLLLSLGSFLGFMTVVVRYKQYNFVAEWNEQEHRKIVRINQFALVVGVITCIGGAVVASFQADQGTSLKGHLTGAACTFTGGVLYMWLNTYLSFKMVNCGINSKKLCSIRFMVSLICMLSFGICLGARYVAANQWNSEKHKHSKEQWTPLDNGYHMHLVSSITEWITALMILTYFLTFHREFEQISFEFRVKRRTTTALPFEVSGEDRTAPLLA